jgi:hypothetical protein
MTSRPSSTPAPAPKATPRYTLSARPEALRCKINTKATWGLFSGGDELLESQPRSGTWVFSAMHTQTPRLLTDAMPLVLSDMNRAAGIIRFKPFDENVKSVYFFSVDDEGAFRVTRLDPVDFHGELRVDAFSGSCEPLTLAEARAVGEKASGSSPDAATKCRNGERDHCVTAARGMRAKDAVNALSLALRGCDLGSRGACVVGVELCDELGYAAKARDLRRRLEGMPEQ